MRDMLQKSHIISIDARQSMHFMSKKAQSHELTYDLIKRAVHGEPEALEDTMTLTSILWWHMKPPGRTTEPTGT